jgi:signal transduction histidine kinase
MQIESVEPVSMTKALLERIGKADISLDVAEGVPNAIRADKRRLAQMLQNLIDNADRYAGGATRIELTGEDGIVRFSVEDQGPGVADHERKFIFERFSRGDTAMRSGKSGAGLGLSLVAEHAALHGGAVTYEDRVGGGSRFIVELPVEGPPS